MTWNGYLRITTFIMRGILCGDLFLKEIMLMPYWKIGAFENAAGEEKKWSMRGNEFVSTSRYYFMRCISRPLVEMDSG